MLFDNNYHLFLFVFIIYFVSKIIDGFNFYIYSFYILFGMFQCFYFIHFLGYFLYYLFDDGFGLSG